MLKLIFSKILFISERFSINLLKMEHIKILENINLLKKYDVYAFDYIEYPHKSFWRNSIKNEEIEKKLEDLCKSEEPQCFTFIYHL